MKLKTLLIVISLVGVIFLAGMLKLAHYAFFAPKMENIRREVFENTKSYVHGKTQELSKLYGEYQKGDESDREIIRNIIQISFTDLEAKHVKVAALRKFLIEQRGY